MTEIRRFLKKPQYLDCVKVYKDTDGRRGISYGTVLNIEISTDWDEASEKAVREIVVLKKSDVTFELSQCDFCLPDHKVRFEDQKKPAKPKHSDREELFMDAKIYKILGI